MDIPVELLMKIFILQPAKSLLRLRGVCKFWDQVISSDFFIKSHLAHHKKSLNTNKYLLLSQGNSFSTILVDCKSYNNVLESYKYNVHDICADQRLESYKIFGVCDGLLCLASPEKYVYLNSPIYLWNPIVRKVKKLPKIDKISMWDSHRAYLCFGHHNNYYKVILVVPRLEACEVYICSLSKNSSWEEIRFNTKSGCPEVFDISPYVKARLVKGTAYFQRRGLRGFVCFDLSCRIVREVELPSSAECFVLEEYQESIALIERNGGDVEMWTLRVGDNSYLWDKKFIVKFDLGLELYYRPMGFVNKENLVIKMKTRDPGYKYFLCNIENKSQQPFTILEEVDEQASLRIFCGLRFYELTESLVLFNETRTTSCQNMQP